jgi:ABC-type glycerol-3-phosphate transport system substrate-binding protein
MRITLAAIMLAATLGLGACGSTHTTEVVTPAPGQTVVVPPSDDHTTTVVTPPAQ